MRLPRDILFGLLVVFVAALSKIFEWIDTPIWRFKTDEQLQRFGWDIGGELVIFLCLLFIFLEVAHQHFRGAIWLIFVMFQVMNVFNEMFDTNRFGWPLALCFWGAGLFILFKLWKRF